MKTTSGLLLFMLLFTCQSASSQSLSYDTIPGDPLKARIYTLENGLKVYLSVYRNEPRFQSMIGIKAGSKNDPADHTGLAHYLEHMLFKGTDRYGTLDYAKESVLLDSIFNLYEQYGSVSDSATRAAIYRKIDEVSGAAAQLAIPNEFDKMMAGMGVTGVNAYTSNDQTVYINNVPSNQLEQFLTVEAERFRKPVMRLFHTELEAVYEEKNRSLDNDNSKVYEQLYSGLFKNHPYGTQTTIGTIEHLKNPSLKAIRNFYEQYYVPNNMIIALSGDFDPDQAIRLINDKFGKMPSKAVPMFASPKEKLIKTPVVREVVGPDAESLTMGFRFKGAYSEEADLLTMVDLILNNGQAGLLDINLNKKQKVLSSSSSVRIMMDHSVHILSARPREGQSMEDVRDLLNGQIMEIKLGNFPDWILPAIITNLRLERQQEYENNMRRASAMLNAEIEGIPYAREVERIERLSRINKQQIIDFVRTWYGDNYVIVYKKTGTDDKIVKVVKPPITPVATNRDRQSDFVARVLSEKTTDIKPEFLDFNTAISKSKLKIGIPVFMVRNRENDLFTLQYTVEMGSNHDRRWPVIMQYLNYLGTAQKTASVLQEEFYKIGASFSAGAGDDEMRITLTGMHSRFKEALVLLEELLSAPVADETALKNLIADINKKRQNARLNKSEILSRLTTYAKFGSESSVTNLLTSSELDALNGQQLCVMLRNLTGYEHRIDYYGPADSAEVVDALSRFHKIPRKLQAIPQGKRFEEQPTADSTVYFVHYEMKQAEINFIFRDSLYDPALQPIVQLYNRYFGGGMSSPVFQTLRESKALAYSVSSRYSMPSKLNRHCYNSAYIGTQADKLPEAMQGMMELLRVLPVSEKNFGQSKDGVLTGIASERITRTGILNTYHALRQLGINDDPRRQAYRLISGYSLNDVKEFHQRHLKDATYRYAVIGNRDKVDFTALSRYGKVVELQLEDIFGY